MGAMLEFLQHPLTILAVGIVSILGLIIFARMHAFLALLISAMILSTMAPGAIDEKIRRVSEGFGGAAANVAIVIALASIIGSCMMASGAADRIVQAFLSLLGEKRSDHRAFGQRLRAGDAGLLRHGVLPSRAHWHALCIARLSTTTYFISWRLLRVGRSRTRWFRRHRGHC